MKILFVMPKFAPGGAEKSLLMLLDFLAKNPDNEIDLLLFKKEGLFLKHIPDNVNVINPNESLKICYSKFKLSNMKTIQGIYISLVRLIATCVSQVFSKNNNHKTQLRWKYAYKKVIEMNEKVYDVACGYLDGETVYYVVDKVNAEIKLGWNQNDYNGLGYDSKMDKYYFDKLNNIITLTPQCYDILVEKFPEVKDKIIQLPPIVSQSFIKKCAKQYIPSEYNGFDGCKLISVGRLVEQKGFDIAIDAANILKDKKFKFRWYIIGNGTSYLKLYNQIKINGLEEYVFLLGENDNPYPYIENADLFIQPSRYEGKSVILTEAKMLEKPIIVTNYATAKDQISNRENGIIVNLNKDDIVDAIMDLYNDEMLMQKLVTNLKNTKFDDNVLKDKYNKTFKIDI